VTNDVRSAGLDPDQARRQLLKERHDVAALQLAADEHLAFRIRAMHLKYRLRNIETDRCDRLHDWLLRIVGALTAPTSLALTVPVDEPSTASEADPTRSEDTSH
jgi:hypothetical protein